MVIWLHIHINLYILHTSIHLKCYYITRHYNTYVVQCIIYTGGTHTALVKGYNREVYTDALARLPTGKAAGPDDIHNDVLMWLPLQFHDMLHRYFTQIWAHQYTPKLWKDSTTILLYKKDDPSQIANNRPIWLKRTIYKLWTTTVTRVLTDYVENNDIIGPAQEGFRRKKSTRNQIHRLSKAMEDALTTDNNIHVLYVDFVDAFGSVDHARLHAILEAMGIPTDAVNIIRDLYEGASIRVRTPKGDTAPIPVQGRGTVQGDTLRPLLFILFIEPLLRWLQQGDKGYHFHTSNTQLGPVTYADDLAIFTNKI